MNTWSYNIIIASRKTITCREGGCDYIVKGESEEEVMKRGAEHAMIFQL